MRSKGATVTLNVTPVSGHTLAGLHVVASNGVVIPVSGNTFTMPEANVTVSATFVSGANSKIYNVICGSNVTASPANPIAQGTKVSLTINAPAGKTLSGLTIKDAANNTVSYASDYTFTMPASDVTVSATFTDSSATAYAITLPTDGKITSNYATAAKGTTVTLNATPADGYDLSSITVMAGSTSVAVSGTGNTRTFVMPEAAVTVTAQYTAKQYTVGVSSVTGGSATVNPTACSVNTNVTVAAVASTGYGLSKIKVIGTGNKVWYEENFTGNVTGSYTFKMPADNVTIVPVFTNASYSIATEVTNPAYGSIAADSTSAIAGSTITVTATPAYCHKLGTLTVKTNGGTDITVSGTGNIRTFTMPADGVKVTATFALIGAYKVNAGGANLRPDQTSTSTPLILIPEGTEICAEEGSTDNWIKATYDGKTGWIAVGALTKL